jgi:hypothetical protein
MTQSFENALSYSHQWLDIISQETVVALKILYQVSLLK